MESLHYNPKNLVEEGITIPQRLPFLEAVCWQTVDVQHFTPAQMLRRYEQGWQYRGILGNLGVEELSFVRILAKYYGSWLATEQQMFDREFHQKILKVLQNVDSDFFQTCQIYFGGGTLISLSHKEYRLSKDIDFLCPVGDSYRLLRQAVAARGYDVLFSTRTDIDLPGDLQTNRYGVRFSVVVDRVPIKFEIVAEERITLGNPDYPDWSPVPCLNETDIFAEKLLANSDRWTDTSVESRDLIDLSMLRLAAPIPPMAIDKAEKAYPVIEPLKRAIHNFQAQPEYRERCFQALGIQAPERIIDGLDLLATDFNIAPTERTFKESKAFDWLEQPLDYQQLWQQYSQNVPTPVLGQQLTVIAYHALQDNLATEPIIQMLLEAPYLKELQQRQGSEKAQEYARLVVRSAKSMQQSNQRQPLQKPDRRQDLESER